MPDGGLSGSDGEDKIESDMEIENPPADEQTEGKQKKKGQFEKGKTKPLNVNMNICSCILSIRLILLLLTSLAIPSNIHVYWPSYNMLDLHW